MENFLANRFGVVNWRQPHLITLRAWNRVRDWNRCQWSDALGLLGLFLFSFGVFYRTLLVHEGLLLMGLAFALRIRTLEKGVMRDPLLILSAAFLLFLLIRTYYTLSEFKEYQSLIWEDMLKLFLFGFLVVFLVAFWMNRYQDRWNQLVIALFAGHIVRVFRKFDWGIFYYEFDKIWNGVYRIGWGSTVNRFGLWSAVIFFGCVILYRHIWGARRQSNELMYWLRVMLWTLAVILSGAGLVYSQSRSAWLAAVLVIPVMLFFQFHQRKKLKLKPVVFIGVLLVVISFMTNLPAVVENRLFLSTNPFYNESFKAAIDARLLLYRLSWEKWKERPWFGYGPGISEVIIKQTEDEYALVRMYNHFHNVALDIMVQLGIFGMLFYGLAFYLIIRQLFRAKKLGRIDRPYFLFALGSLSFMIICGIFGQPFADYKGIFLFGFLGGICYQSIFSIHISARKAQGLKLCSFL
jgi:O-antigen ligase